MFVKKEQVLDYLLQNKIKLSENDYKFFTNLVMIIIQHKRITTNQSELFDKLLGKYQKQLLKKGLSHNEFLSLPWECRVEQSALEYTSAKLTIIDEKIIVKVPFNKKFLQALKQQNYFKWDNISKQYTSTFTTKALKFMVETVPKFFSSVYYCPIISEILEKNKNFNQVIWNPTLKKASNNFFISGINEPLLSAISTIELDDSPVCFYKLSTIGIDIDEKLLQSDIQKFAGHFIFEIDVDELPKLPCMLKTLNINEVFVTRSVLRHNVRHDIKEVLKDVSAQPISTIYNSSSVFRDEHNFVVISYGTIDLDIRMFNKRLSKIIVVRNSRPINLK